MVPEIFSSSFLGWGMLDIIQMVQNLWIKNQRFILPLESFYLSKSTVLPIVTLLKCQSTWSCSRWIVYSSNYWEGDNNQEYVQHASRWSHLLCNSCKVKIQLCGESVLSLLGNNQHSSLWSSQAISQYLARVTHMMLTWCATATLKQSFKLFQIPSYADASWDDDRNSFKSTCCSCIMLFSHAQFNVLRKNFAMSTSAADFIGTCVCAQEVQFKWILAANLALLAICV